MEYTTGVISSSFHDSTIATALDARQIAMNGVLRDGHGREVLPSLSVIVLFSLFSHSLVKDQSAGKLFCRHAVEPKILVPLVSIQIRERELAFDLPFTPKSERIYRNGKGSNHLLQLCDLLIVDQRGGIQREQ